MELSVFISWSGNKGLALADQLSNWLPSIVPSVRAFYSPDLKGGFVWLQSLLNELKNAQFGIVCLTPDNLNSPWLNFEAGALWKTAGKQVPVCPVLLNVRIDQIKGPLAFFQAKKFSKGPMAELCQEIAKRAKFDSTRTSQNFLAAWPRLVEGVREDIRMQRGSK